LTGFALIYTISIYCSKRCLNGKNAARQNIPQWTQSSYSAA
jgi:hypothetical protein